MKLAFIANGLSYGGAEKMLVFVASELFRRGHDVAIFNTCEHSGIIQSIPNGMTIYNANIQTRIKKLGYLKRLYFCIDSAKKFKPDILIGFLTYPNLYSVITGKILGIPSVISERGDPYIANENNNLIGKALLKIVCSANGAVFQTDGASMFYPENLRNRAVVIPNPITINKDYAHKDYSDRENLIISLGRIDNHQKRMDVLIDAFEIFHKKHPEYQLYIYGSGPDKELVQNMIYEKGLSDSAKLMGVSSNSFEDISRGKIFAISSDYEGISNSLLEAMAIGMPVVSTDHSPGGARFLIQNRENGLLTPMGDSKKFAEALCEYVENEKFARICGENASEVLERFSPQIIIDEWEEYLAIL